MPLSYCSTPLITDLEKDGQKEIIFVLISSSFDYLHVMKSDGNELTGFPKVFTGAITAFASGDIDNNGTLDIAIRTALAQGEVIVIDKFGNNLPGFPVPYSDDNYNLAPTLSLYDLDGDGKLEIIVNRLNEVCVFQHNGTIRTGWPRRVVGVSYCHPAVGDIDGDGFGEIILPTYKQASGGDSSALHLFRHNGNYYSPNWPIYYDSAYLTFNGSPILYIDKSNVDSSFITVTQKSYQLKRIRNVSYNFNGQITRRAYIENQYSDYGSIIPTDLDKNSVWEFVSGTQDGHLDTLLHLYNESFVLFPNWPRSG
ncbi:MAG: VCBS repeat-containing protein, partial [Ignavibacteria bacterium]|nr:VCBS repeat-containing protein [Ignavibacteria bacterium]